MLSAAPLDNDASSQFVRLFTDPVTDPFTDPVDMLCFIEDLIVCADVLKLSAQD